MSVERNDSCIHVEYLRPDVTVEVCYRYATDSLDETEKQLVFVLNEKGCKFTVYESVEALFREVFGSTCKNCVFQTTDEQALDRYLQGKPFVRKDIFDFALAFKGAYGYGDVDTINSVISHYEQGRPNTADLTNIVDSWVLVQNLKGK